MQWRSGVYHGFGVEYFARGSAFQGSYVRGMRDGYGVCSYYNGDYFEGEWAGGLRHGCGMSLRPLLCPPLQSLCSGVWSFHESYSCGASGLHAFTQVKSPNCKAAAATCLAWLGVMRTREMLEVSTVACGASATKWMLCSTQLHIDKQHAVLPCHQLIVFRELHHVLCCACTVMLVCLVK